MRDGVLRVLPDAETVLVPVADGGDGTLETLVEGSGGEIRSASVTGPLGERRDAEWGAMGDGATAVIEMARTSGLALVPSDALDPMNATTYGLGEAIRAALERGLPKTSSSESAAARRMTRARAWRKRSALLSRTPAALPCPTAARRWRI